MNDPDLVAKGRVIAERLAQFDAGKIPVVDTDWSVIPPESPLDDEPDREPSVVDGAKLLDEIERFAGRFLAFPSVHYLVVIVLWIAHTWAVAAFYVTPRLVLDSPEPGSGKTRALEVLALLCPNAKLTISTTTAALYRRIAKASIDDPAAVGGGELFYSELLPTILQDEADAIFGRTNNPQTEDLRALYNSGYKRGATVDRCEGDAKNMQVREFPVFAPVALAGLAGRMPRTILDRAVVLHMRRRAPDEHIDEFRERDARVDAFPLREKLCAWAWSDWDGLRALRPNMPDGVRDRPAEVWEALLAIAEFARGEWPERAREACRYFVLDTEADDKLSLGVRLLRDVKTVLGDCDRMFSAEIVAALTSDPESEWADMWGKPLDQRHLAKELKRYGIESQDVRIGSVSRKGYLVAGDSGLAQAWHRYLVSGPERDKGDTGDIAGQSDSHAPASATEARQARHDRDIRDTSATAETPPNQGLFGNVALVADVAPTDGNAEHNGQHVSATEPSCRSCGAELRLPGQRARGFCGAAACVVANRERGTR